jgi:hypothetical protein
MSTPNTTTTTGGVIARHVIDTVCDIANLERDAVYTEYSGRGMHGQTCFGVVMAPGEVARFRAVLSAVTPHIGLSWADAAIDSLGLDAIVYFPGWWLADEPAPASAEPIEAGIPRSRCRRRGPEHGAAGADTGSQCPIVSADKPAPGTGAVPVPDGHGCWRLSGRCLGWSSQPWNELATAQTAGGGQ